MTPFCRQRGHVFCGRIPRHSMQSEHVAEHWRAVACMHGSMHQPTMSQRTPLALIEHNRRRNTQLSDSEKQRLWGRALATQTDHETADDELLSHSTVKHALSRITKRNVRAVQVEMCRVSDPLLGHGGCRSVFPTDNAQGTAKSRGGVQAFLSACTPFLVPQFNAGMVRAIPL